MTQSDKTIQLIKKIKKVFNIKELQFRSDVKKITNKIHLYIKKNIN